ncbi:hypothetical protein G9A89_006245 [Geosiphon pyriformis]|nr:hypothetical protein G9A89_006245 [Geosiphon pyriformis]
MPNVTNNSQGQQNIDERLKRWKKRLENLTHNQLPTDYPRPLPLQVVEAVQTLHLPETTAYAVLQLSLAISSNRKDRDDDKRIGRKSVVNLQSTEPQNEHPSAFTILLAAFTVLLYRYTGDEDITVGSSSDSRNPLVLRLSINPSETFEQVVQRIEKVEREASADEVPFQLLLSYLFPEKDSLSSSSSIHGPLFRVRFFNQTDTPENPILQATSITTDLTVFITSHSSSSLRHALLPGIEIRISYNQVIFSSRRITHILEQLVTIINIAAQNRQNLIGQIPILTPTCLEILPDPKSNLKWDEFHGAITDIFAKNAKKWPGRICVSESVEGKSHKRVFTYRKINEASNLIAHYLVAKGIEREDVVIIYAYRGVDLVIAVMGVLKAGATFSVIDPAYPPERQNIYLQVAQPRGIIVLKNAGTLNPIVRSYIQEKLSIRCEIPALQISEGSQGLKGGEVDGNDILNMVHDRETQDVGIIIGPDSIGTLSFTSGSTGIPKGVRGRHFSLTHYYPWMAQEFGLSEKDRFTMLSGIAHDPIQRDIFTPMFLGAELHIPTSEDIGVPGRLATWMAENKITVTHLTPAMGQLLSANASTPIPSLRNAFFVGDILTKRDCNRLQHLAVNTSVINMYGTTETQRSVSYFTIPSIVSAPAFLGSQKDVIPAGRGMENVQLLVVNRQNKSVLCGVGEIGEIYVRAGGLAEGYLQLEDLTCEKFLKNWFNESAVEEPDDKSNEEWRVYWKGKRDRMYRTGDLGRYRPDGNVECTGRADDQIKIRGFRIELGEIDTHLSQHQLVRENVTLVRRDKYEEQTLVSYFVPVESDEFQSSADEDDKADGLLKVGQRNYRRLIKEIREYLKMRLPSYSVPSVFVPLRKMPLTPNGKIDKTALPFPDTAQVTTSTNTTSFSATTSQSLKLTPIEGRIQTIWSQLLPDPPKPYIPLDENFFDLGGHSILATRLVFELRKTCGVNVSLGLVFQQPTIRGQAKEIEVILSGELNIAIEDDDLNKPNEVNRESPNAKNIDKEKEGEQDFNYAAELELLTLEYLLEKYEPLLENSSRKTFFVTGATGFLGAFILSALLNIDPSVRVIAHVRAKTKELAIDRLQKSLVAHMVWQEDWVEQRRLDVVCGDLEKERLGIDENEWNSLSERVDVIIHNGALVHWVYPYTKLKAANVISTLWAIRLASIHHTKSFHFVSSTSVLDTEYYIQLSDKIVENGGQGVCEDDNLEGSRRGLRSGYGQSKWVSEKLVFEAKARGLPATIVRPGYIVGHSRTGVTNTDDFIWRLIKGCIQLGLVPTIHNIVNMCPVDYVADCIAQISLSLLSPEKGVFHITHPINPSIRFDDLFAALPFYGYAVEKIDYIVWRNKLMEFTLLAQDNALYPLLHFVLDDLPTSTKSPELDDSHTREIVTRECDRIDKRLIGIYLGYLVKVGFLDRPSIEGRTNETVNELPDVEIPMAGVEALKRSGRN